MPLFALVLAGFGLAVILFPALLSLLVGGAFLAAGLALLAVWQVTRRKSPVSGRTSVKVGGVEIFFPEKR